MSERDLWQEVPLRAINDALSAPTTTDQGARPDAGLSQLTDNLRYRYPFS